MNSFDDGVLKILFPSESFKLKLSFFIITVEQNRMEQLRVRSRFVGERVVSDVCMLPHNYFGRGKGNKMRFSSTFSFILKRLGSQSVYLSNLSYISFTLNYIPSSSFFSSLQLCFLSLWTISSFLLSYKLFEKFTFIFFCPPLSKQFIKMSVTLFSLSLLSSSSKEVN